MALKWYLLLANLLAMTKHAHSNTKNNIETRTIVEAIE